MQATKSPRATIAVLAAIAWSVVLSPAAEPIAECTTNLPTLMAQVRREEGPGLLPADRAYVTAGTNTFAFLVPPNFRMESWNDGRVALVSRDYSCQITFQLAGPLPPERNELDSDYYSGRVLMQYPGAKIISVFSAIADSRRGPAYEIECTGTGGTSRRGQVAFIPSRFAVLEFSLVCSPARFESARRQLNTVMLTFRASDANGELHISPLSDKL
jgi:hypothetical protein